MSCRCRFATLRASDSRGASMNRGKSIFAQITEHLPLTTFRRCVARYGGEHKVKKFSCLDQYLCMAFAQLTYRESLHDIEVCLRAQANKLYHMGIKSGISRSTLADANEVRDWRIYADFAGSLIGTHVVFIRRSRSVSISRRPSTPWTLPRLTCVFPYSHGRTSVRRRPR